MLKNKSIHPLDNTVHERKIWKIRIFKAFFLVSSLLVRVSFCIVYFIVLYNGCYMHLKWICILWNCGRESNVCVYSLFFHSVCHCVYKCESKSNIDNKYWFRIILYFENSFPVTVIKQRAHFQLHWVGLIQDDIYHVELLTQLYNRKL